MSSLPAFLRPLRRARGGFLTVAVGCSLVALLGGCQTPDDDAYDDRTSRPLAYEYQHDRYAHAWFAPEADVDYLEDPEYRTYTGTRPVRDDRYTSRWTWNARARTWESNAIPAQPGMETARIGGGVGEGMESGVADAGVRPGGAGTTREIDPASGLPRAPDTGARTIGGGGVASGSGTGSASAGQRVGAGVPVENRTTSGGGRSFNGRVRDVTTMDLGGQQRTLVQLQLDDGRVALVDLGTGMGNTLRLQRGDDLWVSGSSQGRINRYPVLRASEVRTASGMTVRPRSDDTGTRDRGTGSGGALGGRDAGMGEGMGGRSDTGNRNPGTGGGEFGNRNTGDRSGTGTGNRDDTGTGNRNDTGTGTGNRNDTGSNRNDTGTGSRNDTGNRSGTGGSGSGNSGSGSSGNRGSGGSGGGSGGSGSGSGGSGGGTGSGGR